MNLKVGKFEINKRGWYWNQMRLHHPVRILWNLLLMPFYYVALGLYCLVLAVYTLDMDQAKDVWRQHQLF